MLTLVAFCVIVGALIVGAASLLCTIAPALPKIARALRGEPQLTTETPAQQRWRRIHLAGDRARDREETSL